MNGSKIIQCEKWPNINERKNKYTFTHTCNYKTPPCNTQKISYIEEKNFFKSNNINNNNNNEQKIKIHRHTRSMQNSNIKEKTLLNKIIVNIIKKNK